MSLLSSLADPLSLPVRRVGTPLLCSKCPLLLLLLLWDAVCMLSSSRCFCLSSHCSMRGAGRLSSGSHESSYPSDHLQSWAHLN